MKIKKLKNKKLIILCALVLVAVIVLSQTIPMLLSKSIKSYSYTTGNSQGVDFSPAYDVEVSGNKSRKMLINSQNGAVAIVSSSGEEIFNSASVDAAKYSLSNALDVRLRDRSGNVYLMNSTDNSVAFGTFEVMGISVKKASVKFDMFPDESAVADGVSKADVFASVTLDLTFDGSCFVASVDTSTVLLPKGFCLEKVSILPGLFSVNQGVSGEKYIIPDGCGAVVDLFEKNQQDFSEKFSVYGTDVALYNHEEGAYLPFFAYSRKECLVNTIITQGDALSEITFKKFADGGGYLYNTFTVTACGIVKDSYVKGESYNGVISQSYYVSEDITDYNAVAAQVREVLLAKNYISSGLSQKPEVLPFFINVVGSPNGKKAVTTFEDTTEIVALLKSRGVKNVALRLSGVGDKGINTFAEGSLKLSEKLGGEDGYNALVGKLGEGDRLWIDYNMFVKKADYKNRPVELYSTISDFAGFEPTAFSVADSDDIKKNISKTYKSFNDSGVKDLCINDASSVLFTDVDSKVSRQDVLDVISDGVQTLDINSSIMLGSPAVYLMKQADTVFYMPEAATLQTYSGVTAVPVLQMVVHGSVVYGTNPMNTTNLSLQDAMLKAVEYGGVPSFVFTHNSNSTLDYNAYISSVAKVYETAEKTFPLIGKTITSHQSVLAGVYKVTYDYSKTVYVNYNPSVVTVNGIMVPPKDFIII